MILHTRADAVTVQSDEQGFELFIETDEGDNITVNIQACVFDFYAAVQTEVRPYILEAEMARSPRTAAEASVWSASIAAHLSEQDETGYDLDDPKHPTYHERMVGDA